jgi:hypothetical protein
MALDVVVSKSNVRLGMDASRAFTVDGTVGAPPAWRLGLMAAASHMPYQIVQSTVKALTVHTRSSHKAAIVQNSAIHNEFTHSAQ